MIQECKFNFVFLANFQPLPGTPVYDDLVAAGVSRKRRREKGTIDAAAACVILQDWLDEQGG